jgi:hypothetical protein
MPAACKIVAQWVAHLLNELQQWPYYKMCRISLEWFCCERSVLNQIMQLMEFWHGLVNQNSNDIHPQSLWKHKVSQTPSSMKLMISLIYGFHGVFVCHLITQVQIVNPQFYSHFSSIICVVQLGRSVQDLLKMGSFLHWGVGCAAVPTLLWPQSMWLWSDSKTEITMTWQMIGKQREYRTGSLALGGKHWHIRWCWWCFLPSPPVATDFRQSRRNTL